MDVKSTLRNTSKTFYIERDYNYRTSEDGLGGRNVAVNGGVGDLVKRLKSSYI